MLIFNGVVALLSDPASAAAGDISTIVGTGVAGSTGDGGPATAAPLTLPAAVAFDAAGNLIFADSGNHRIRRITPAGTVTTVAGNGAPGFSGDGGPATAAQLRTPAGIAFDPAGNLIIGDYG